MPAFIKIWIDFGVKDRSKVTIHIFDQPMCIKKSKLFTWLVMNEIASSILLFHLKVDWLRTCKEKGIQPLRPVLM